MKLAGKMIFTLLCFLLLPGCYDQMVLEDASLALMIGMDVDASNHLVIYSQSPVFYKEAKDKSENASVTASSLRESREKLDSILTGLTTAGKNQTILIGKHLLEQKDWYSLMDLFYRDPKQSATSRVVAVDGRVDDIFYFKPKDKPRLSIHMRKLIDTARTRSITVKTKVQDLRRQMKEKGVTPSITEIKKMGDKILITGTALLNKQGYYALDLSLEDSMLLLILQDHVTVGDLSFSIPTAEALDGTTGYNPYLTFNARLAKKKVKTTYSEAKFQFDVSMKFLAQVTSFNYLDHTDSKEGKTQLEQQMAKELKNRFEALIKKCQENDIDPFGFGLYARAYQYPAWKTVQNEWGKAFAKAAVHVTPQVVINSIGVTE